MPYYSKRIHSTRSQPVPAPSPAREIVPAPTPPREIVAAPPSREEGERLADSFWEARGGGQGSPWEDWFRAEQELRNRKG
jgi:hypothetical protein